MSADLDEIEVRAEAFRVEKERPYTDYETRDTTAYDSAGDVPALIAEVRRLRDWKESGLVVMGEYQDLAMRVVPDCPDGLGRRWVDLLAEHIDHVAAERDALCAQRDAVLDAIASQGRNGFSDTEAMVRIARALGVTS